jgi:hypothetical protein
MNSISRVQPCVTEGQWNKAKARKNLVFVHFATVPPLRRLQLHPTTRASMHVHLLHGRPSSPLPSNPPYPAAGCAALCACKGLQIVDCVW